MTSSRPVIKITLTIFDKALEIAGLIMLLVLWFQVVTSYSALPDTIPTHFNFSGKADNFGPKQMFLVLPILGTLLFSLLTWLNGRPNIYNYATTITNENALAQYTIATKMIRVLKVTVLILFNILLYKKFQTSIGEKNGLGSGVLLYTIVLIIGPVVYFLWKSITSKKKQKMS